MAEGARQVAADAARERAAPPGAADRTPASVPASVLALQRAAGNRAVTALLQRQEEESSSGSGYRPRVRLLDEQLHLDPSFTARHPRAAFDRRLGELLYADAVRHSVLTSPDLDRPAWLPQPGEQPAAPEPPAVPAGAGPEEARPASAGDAFRAVMAIPAVDSAVTTLRGRASEQASRDWGRLSPGERGLVITSGATIAGAAIAGVVSDQKTRDFALQQLHGRDLPVPGVDGLSVQFRTQREDLGLNFSFDVGRHLPESWGFGRR